MSQGEYDGLVLSCKESTDTPAAHGNGLSMVPAMAVSGAVHDAQLSGPRLAVGTIMQTTSRIAD